MEYDASSVYGEVKLLLKDMLTDVSYETWFENMKPLTVDNNVLILETDRGSMGCEIITSRFSDHILQCFQRLDYTDLSFKVVEPDSYKPEAKKDKDELINERIRAANLFARHTFDEFVEGATNRLAYAASIAVAEMPGGQYNPLFIWGSSGLGKTHLMQAIGNHILQTDPEKKV